MRQLFVLKYYRYECVKKVDIIDNSFLAGVKQRVWTFLVLVYLLQFLKKHFRRNMSPLLFFAQFFFTRKEPYCIQYNQCLPVVMKL
jgi:hypothetical protein